MRAPGWTLICTACPWSVTSESWLPFTFWMAPSSLAAGAEFCAKIAGTARASKRTGITIRRKFLNIRMLRIDTQEYLFFVQHGVTNAVLRFVSIHLLLAKLSIGRPKLLLSEAMA
jgi:hypothetical protein